MALPAAARGGMAAGQLLHAFLQQPAVRADKEEIWRACVGHGDKDSARVAPGRGWRSAIRRSDLQVRKAAPPESSHEGNYLATTLTSLPGT
ncbi:hypothetical protein JCM14635_02050 [Megalodesulfovibrio paquesii]